MEKVIKNINSLIFRKSNNVYIQFFRYFFVGGIAFLSDFFTLYFFTNFLNIHYLISAIIGFIFGVIVNYFLSIKWVFFKRVFEDRVTEFFIFLFIGIIGLLLNEFFIWFFTEELDIFYLWSKIISTGIVYVFNFFARKYFLFK